MSLYTTHTIIQHSLDVLMQRLVNQGLIGHFQAQSALAMRVRDAPGGGLAAVAHCKSASITVHELRSILFLVVLGQLASVLVFGAEVVVHRLQQRRRQDIL